MLPLVADVDYIPNQPSVIFINGSSLECAAIGIVDDSTVESTESFAVLLSNITPGVIVTQPSEASVLILDNDGNYSDVCLDW